jgi:hypothetical protein
VDAGQRARRRLRGRHLRRRRARHRHREQHRHGADLGIEIGAENTASSPEHRRARQPPRRQSQGRPGVRGFAAKSGG